MQLAHGNQDHPSMSPRCAKRGGPEAGECFLKLGMTGFPHVEIRSPRSRKIPIGSWTTSGCLSCFMLGFGLAIPLSAIETLDARNRQISFLGGFWTFILAHCEGTQPSIIIKFIFVINIS